MYLAIHTRKTGWISYKCSTSVYWIKHIFISLELQTYQTFTFLLSSYESCNCMLSLVHFSYTLLGQLRPCLTACLVLWQQDKHWTEPFILAGPLHIQYSNEFSLFNVLFMGFEVILSLWMWNQNFRRRYSRCGNKYMWLPVFLGLSLWHFLWLITFGWAIFWH